MTLIAVLGSFVGSLLTFWLGLVYTWEAVTGMVCEFYAA